MVQAPIPTICAPICTLTTKTIKKKPAQKHIKTIYLNLHCFYGGLILSFSQEVNSSKRDEIFSFYGGLYFLFYGENTVLKSS